MVASGNVSVPSSSGQVLLHVTGTSTLNMAQQFASVLNNAENAGTLRIEDLDTPMPAPAGGTVNDYSLSVSGAAATVPAGGGYVVDDATGSTTITGSGDGDSVLAAGGAVNYVAAAGGNDILFISGDNAYVGSSVGGAGAADTITAGQGNDSITAGTNDATVFSGTGDALITLSDTAASGSGANDTVLLSDGHSTVDAFGTDDAVFVTGQDQTINAGKSSLDQDLVTLSPTLAGAAGGDTVSANAADLLISEAAGGNSIVGGTGLLTLIGASVTGLTPQIDTVQAGSGTTNIFGGSGGSFELRSASADLASFIAGTGDETINAATAAGITNIFGSDSGSLSITGGSGVVNVIGGAAATIQSGSGEANVFANMDGSFALRSAASDFTAFIGGAGSETIDATSNLGTLDVFADTAGSLSILGGAGALNFIGGTTGGGSQAVTIAGATGPLNIFGTDGDGVTLIGAGGASGAAFAAGAGNETLDGSHYDGNFAFYAANLPDSVTGNDISESVVGGSGVTYFVTGGGSETLVGGSGLNAFDLDKTLDGLGGTITIYNYNGANGDYIDFSGFTATEEQEAISSAAATTNGLVGTQLLLSDNTTVLFVDASVSDLVFNT